MYWLRKTISLVPVLLTMAMALLVPACGGSSSTSATDDDTRGNLAPAASISVTPTHGSAPLNITCDASGSNDSDGRIVRYQWDFGDGTQVEGVTANHIFSTTGNHTIHLTVTDDDGAITTTSISVIVIPDPNSSLPPEPEDIAPPLAAGTNSSIIASTAFLYTGDNPVQSGVDPVVIDPLRAAVLRGRVIDTKGAAQPGVTIRVINHPEYGKTQTRTDGYFDLAVNADRNLIVRYEKSGYLPAQRNISPQQQDFTWLPDVALLQPDSVATAVDTSGTAEMQVARGSLVTDDDGQRQATLLLPTGTQASLVMADGSMQAVDSLTLRLTEYTTGNTGAAALPGELPPTSGYTYALELGSDEAVAKVDGRDVILNQKIPFYVENFLGFSTGTLVPVGYYDNSTAKWVASENGRVIEILDIDNNLATVDVDGDGNADSGTTLDQLGITAEERKQLATLYKPGDTVWRIRIQHLSTY
ncbi:MAG: PKD domain-containing protein, partial [Mariprofundales bacterium]|nr:PKD domain-containing protein [Mariprofundales bacterium]